MDNIDRKINPADGKKTAMGCITVIAAIFIFSFIYLVGCDDEKSSAPEVKKFEKLNALVMSREFVKERLKSPSTAEFGSELDNIIQANDTIFYVKSYVDSQNSFGAMMRNNYSCTLIYDPKTDNVKCRDLIISQR